MLPGGATWVIVIRDKQFRLVRKVVPRLELGLKPSGHLGKAQITAPTTRVADFLG